jgi:hypothetical protein
VFANGSTLHFQVSETQHYHKVSSCLIIECVPCSLASLTGLPEFILNINPLKHDKHRYASPIITSSNEVLKKLITITKLKHYL